MFSFFSKYVLLFVDEVLIFVWVGSGSHLGCIVRSNNDLFVDQVFFCGKGREAKMAGAALS